MLIPNKRACISANASRPLLRRVLRASIHQNLQSRSKAKINKRKGRTLPKRQLSARNAFDPPDRVHVVANVPSCAAGKVQVREAIVVEDPDNRQVLWAKRRARRKYLCSSKAVPLRNEYTRIPFSRLTDKQRQLGEPQGNSEQTWREI